MLMAQNDPQAQQPPAEGQTQQRAQQTVSVKIAKSDDGKYALVDSAGTMYKLDDQSGAKKFAGKKVTLSGTVKTASNTIHVAKIKAAS
jgi:hypothetical protein